MGSGTSIKCSHCNYKILLFEGIGMMMMPEEYECAPSIQPNGWEIVGSKKILKEVEELMTNKNGKFISKYEDLPEYIKERFNENSYYAYGKKIYYSHNTKQVRSLFYFVIKYEEDGIFKYYEPIYVDKFKQPFKMLQSSDDIYSFELICPKCKNKMDHRKSNEITIIFWD